MSPCPDLPVPFGYKVAWLALCTADTAAVAEELRLSDVRPATWQEGVSQAYESAVFVTPPLGPWSLAVGFSLAPPGEPVPFVKPLLERLSSRFEESQYYCTHRVVEFHAWGRALCGRLVRGYAYVGESGQTLWDEGDQTAEERALGFRFFDERSADAAGDDYWGRKDLVYPDEDCVMRLAGAWSVNPTTLEEHFREPGLGLLGTLAPNRVSAASNRPSSS